MARVIWHRPADRTLEAATAALGVGDPVVRMGDQNSGSMPRPLRLGGKSTKSMVLVRQTNPFREYDLNVGVFPKVMALIQHDRRGFRRPEGCRRPGRLGAVENFWRQTGQGFGGKTAEQI